MDACLNQNAKQVDKASGKASPPALSDSCNLLALSGTASSEPRLKLRSETSVTSGTSSSQAGDDSLPGAPVPVGIPCDPCTGKTEESKEQATAKDAKPSLLSKLWIDGGLLSYHPTDHTHQFNDLNYGAGLEFEKSPSLGFAAGEYRNSVRHNSYYGMVEYKPLHLGPVRAGIAGGTINGYPAMFNGKFFPAAMPLVSIEEKHAGVNFVYIPSVKGVVPALSMQLKFRF